MTLYNDYRPLRVFVGNEEIAKDNRIVTKGRSSMTLLPDFYTVDMYNITDTDTAKLARAKTMYIYVGEELTLICTGTIEGIYSHEEGGNEVTSVSLSDGIEMWTAKTNIAIGRGSSVKDAMKRITAGFKLAPYFSGNARFPRGQAFSGGIIDPINILSKSVNARAFITNGTLYVIDKGQIINHFVLREDDLVIEPRYVGNVCIVKTLVSGYTSGAVVDFNNIQYRIIARAISVDNMEGDWDTEMVLFNESKITKEEMGGGW